MRSKTAVAGYWLQVEQPERNVKNWQSYKTVTAISEIFKLEFQLGVLCADLGEHRVSC